MVDDGTWSWRSWDKDSKTVEGADVTFTGTWGFTPKPEPKTQPKAQTVKQKITPKLSPVMVRHTLAKTGFTGG